MSFSNGVLFARTPIAEAVITWDPLFAPSANVTYSNNNLTCTSANTASWRTRGTESVTSGKYYFEVLLNYVEATKGFGIGLVDATWTTIDGIVSTPRSIGVDTSNGQVWYNGTRQDGEIGILSSGMVLCIAFDYMNNRLHFRRNNDAWGNLGNPVANTGGYTFPLSGAIYAGMTMNNTTGAQATARFSASSWSYAAPAGFVEWD